MRSLQGMLALFASILMAASPAPRLTVGGTEGDAQAFTSLTDMQGKPEADGRFTQTVSNDVLHIEERYDFPGGRVAIEKASVRLHPLQQETWSWDETQGGKPVREFSIDFKTGHAMGAHHGEKEEHWDEHIKIEPGKTWTGIAFIEPIKAMRESVKQGQKMDLYAIGMSPKPRKVKVTITHVGAQKIDMAGRKVDADKFLIHPDVPAVAKLFVKVPDNAIYLVSGKPAAFLRYEGPLCEPSDPLVHVDLIDSPSANAHAAAP
jgi:hypothetical protein